MSLSNKAIIYLKEGDRSYNDAAIQAADALLKLITPSDDTTINVPNRTSDTIGIIRS